MTISGQKGCEYPLPLITIFDENKFVAAEPNTSAFKFHEREAPRPIEVENLFRPGSSIRVPPAPVDNVTPVAHASVLLVLRPRPKVFPRPQGQQRAQR